MRKSFAAICGSFGAGGRTDYRLGFGSKMSSWHSLSSELAMGCPRRHAECRYPHRDGGMEALSCAPQGSPDGAWSRTTAGAQSFGRRPAFMISFGTYDWGKNVIEMLLVAKQDTLTLLVGIRMPFGCTQTNATIRAPISGIPRYFSRCLARVGKAHPDR